MRQMGNKLPQYLLMKIQWLQAMDYYLGHDKQEEKSLCLKVDEDHIELKIDYVKKLKCPYSKQLLSYAWERTARHKRYPYLQ